MKEISDGVVSLEKIIYASGIKCKVTVSFPDEPGRGVHMSEDGIVLAPGSVKPEEFIRQSSEKTGDKSSELGREAVILAVEGLKQVVKKPAPVLSSVPDEDISSKMSGNAGSPMGRSNKERDLHPFDE